ncbi:MAG: hypothetical protein WCK32_08265 [Chlorobiaceae bacterium]
MGNILTVIFDAVQYMARPANYKECSKIDGEMLRILFHRLELPSKYWHASIATSALVKYIDKEATTTEDIYSFGKEAGENREIYEEVVRALGLYQKWILKAAERAGIKPEEIQNILNGSSSILTYALGLKYQVAKEFKLAEEAEEFIRNQRDENGRPDLSADQEVKKTHPLIEAVESWKPGKTRPQIFHTEIDKIKKKHGYGTEQAVKTFCDRYKFSEHVKAFEKSYERYCKKLANKKKGR